MTLQEELNLSYYQTVAVLDEAHAVWLVRHSESGKFFVKKVLASYNADIYRTLQACPLPHMPRIVEAAEKDGVLILIEEYLSGQTLQELLEQGHVFSPEEIRGYTSQLARILQNLHAFHPPIIHRDVKPSNIILSPDGFIKLLDLDAAKYMRADEERDTRLIGTPGYAAPEQYGFGASGIPTDIYAVGMVMKDLLNASSEPAAPACRYLQTVMERCTRLDPAQRYPDTEALLRDLTQPLPVPQPAPAPSPVRQPSDSSSTQKAAASWQRFLPPGFRSLKILPMLLSTLGYYSLFRVCLDFTFEEGIHYNTPISVFRVLLILGFLAMIALDANYLGIQDRLKISQLKWPVRILMLIVLNVFLFGFIVFLISQILEKVFA